MWHIFLAINGGIRMIWSFWEARFQRVAITKFEQWCKEYLKRKSEIKEQLVKSSFTKFLKVLEVQVRSVLVNFHSVTNLYIIKRIFWNFKLIIRNTVLFDFQKWDGNIPTLPVHCHIRSFIALQQEQKIKFLQEFYLRTG